MTPATRASGRIPSLDGLRAISIALVIFWHLVDGRVPAHYLHVFNVGRFGVRIFFVISGFLITHLLMRERERTGAISLRDFYVRRTLRIFPAFYAFLVVVAVLDRTGVVHLLPADLLSAATYTMNYNHKHSLVVGHLWSLSVEEQFYLVWPVLYATGYVRAAAVAVLAAPVIRAACYHWPAIGGAGLGESFPTVMDALATGCCLALYRERLWAWAPYRSFIAGRWIAALPLVAVAAMLLPQKLQIVAGDTVANIAVAMMIDRVVRLPIAALNTRPIVFVGTLSYSLYLWQQLFLNYDDPVVPFGWWSLPLALLAALVGHYAIERPALRLRRHNRSA